MYETRDGQGADEVFSHKISENTELRLLEERHAQELTDLTDRNREHLRRLWGTRAEAGKHHVCDREQEELRHTRVVGFQARGHKAPGRVAL
jgi:hypothetical protein